MRIEKTITSLNALLQNDGLDMLGYLYHALSLNADIEVLFDENRPDEYNLFDVRYVVAPIGRVFPSFVKPLRDFGANRLYQVDTTGYFDLVSTTITGGTSSTTALHDSTEAAQFKAQHSELKVQAAE